MGSLSIWHWVIILAVLVLLFGAKKLPDTARGIGRSLRILKSEVAAMNDDSMTPSTATSEPSSVRPQVPAADPALR